MCQELGIHFVTGIGVVSLHVSSSCSVTHRKKRCRNF
ncbi:DUF3678 domain-containing protein [Escherichia coli]|nr:DUF3678 domain-containing protein [Escherichia coli]